eukprot:m51a1_g3970 hypothetical protein (282) ;mRNA; f:407324-411288
MCTPTLLALSARAVASLLASDPGFAGAHALPAELSELVLSEAAALLPPHDLLRRCWRPDISVLDARRASRSRGTLDLAPALSSCGSLCRIDLRCCRVDNSQLSELLASCRASVSELAASIEISNSESASALARSVSSCAAMGRLCLKLRVWDGVRVDLSPLSSLASLRVLVLRGDVRQCAGVAEAVCAPREHLKVADVGGAALTDADVVRLIEAAPLLRELRLHDSRKLTAHLFEHLLYAYAGQRAPRSLRVLDVAGTMAQDQIIKGLKAARAKLKDKITT